LARAVRARFEGGVLKPLEDLDLEEGEEVILTGQRSCELVRDSNPQKT
jgi:predicted DNA-binding antitoxin AbrB/MazE fold protein